MLDAQELVPETWKTRDGRIIVTFAPPGCNKKVPGSVTLGLGYAGEDNPCFPTKTDLIEISKFLLDVAETMK